MLTIYGGKQRFCDGVSRRSFLKIGGFAMGAVGGLSLTDILRAEAATGKKSSHKAIINVFLAGGAPHQDTFDLKPDAPADIRGEMKPINTNLDGLQICEVFPRLAKMADKYALIRSIVGSAGDHDAYQCLTGWPRNAMAAQGGYPAIGSVLAKVQGPTERSVPTAVGLASPAIERRWTDSGAPGFLGPAYAPFKPFSVAAAPDSYKLANVVKENSPGLDNIKLRDMSLERLRDRKKLLASLDAHRRDMDSNLDVQAMDAATQAAFDVLTSSKLADALDVSKEPVSVRERYGDGKPYKYQYDGAPTSNDHLLMARRLIEIGVRSVTISFGRWDSHGDNFGMVRDHGSKLDQCLSALLEDLEQRGMIDDVTVICWGEFGRTPAINKDAGRDHWPQVNAALLAGGGMKVGQVIGSTTPDGGHAQDRPVHVHEIFSTLYHNLGINTTTTHIQDMNGRPQYIADNKEPIPELVG
jgi:hypothetical protein